MAGDRTDAREIAADCPQLSSGTTRRSPFGDGVVSE
jgi:hypothetical protein